MKKRLASKTFLLFLLVFSLVHIAHASPEPNPEMPSSSSRTITYDWDASEKPGNGEFAKIISCKGSTPTSDNYRSTLADQFSVEEDSDCQSGLKLVYGDSVHTSSGAYNNQEHCLYLESENPWSKKLFRGDGWGDIDSTDGNHYFREDFLLVSNSEFDCADHRSNMYYTFIYLEEPITRGLGLYSDDYAWVNFHRYYPSTHEVDGVLGLSDVVGANNAWFTQREFPQGWYIIDFVLSENEGNNYFKTTSQYACQQSDTACIEQYNEADKIWAVIGYASYEPPTCDNIESSYDCDTDQYMCESFGGQFLSEDMRSESIIYDMDSLCCGAGDSYANMLNGDYICVADDGGSYQWQAFTDMCTAGGNALLPIEIDVDYSALNGLDGCCGDDDDRVILTDGFDSADLWTIYEYDGLPYGTIVGGRLESTQPSAVHRVIARRTISLNPDHISNFIFSIDADYTPTDIFSFYGYLRLINADGEVVDFDQGSLESTCATKTLSNGVIPEIEIDIDESSICTFELPDNIINQIEEIQIRLSGTSSNEFFFDNLKLSSNFDAENGDLGTILTQTGSGDYENQYLCLSDFDSSEESRVEYFDDSGEWNWWLANTPDQSFTIHRAPYGDVVSNGYKWFTCDPDLDLSENKGVGVDNYLTFENPVPPVGSGEGYCYIPDDLSVVTELNDDGVEVDLSSYLFTSNAAACRDGNLDYNGIAENLAALPMYSGTSIDSQGGNFFTGCCIHPDAQGPGWVSEYGPHNGWDLFKWTTSEIEQCGGPCYDTAGQPTAPTPGDNSGNPSLPPSGDGSSSDDPKEGFIPHSGWGGRQQRSCIDYAYLNSIPVNQIDVCNINEMCIAGPGGYQLYTNDGAETCCIYGSCVGREVVTCEDRAGGSPSIIISEDSDPPLRCLGLELEHDELSDVGPGQTCCIGSWIMDSFEVDQDLTGSETYICYDDPVQDIGRWAECCSPTGCHNWPMAVDDGNSGTRFDSGSVFTTGSQLHTFASFDSILDGELSDGAVDNYRVYRLPYGPNANKEFVPLDYRIIYLEKNFKDLSAYDYFTFDTYWTGNFRPSNIIFFSENEFYDKTVLENISLEDFSMHPEIKELLWNRMTVPIPQSLSGVDGFYFETKRKNYYLDVDTYIYFDNFVAHMAEGDEYYNNYYCTGPFGQWISSLSPEEFNDIPGIDQEEIDAAKLACDYQMSFGWTGSRCCGSESIKSIPGNFSQAEYYEDTFAGCWGGVKVDNNERVSDAYNDFSRHPELLFYQGDFFECVREIPANYDGSIGPDILQEMPNIELNPQPPFTIKGKWYCDPGTNVVGALWKPIDDLSRTRILMTALYGLSTNNFALQCDDSGRDVDISPAVNMPQGAAGGAPNPADSAALCVLNNYDNNDETDSLVVGAVIDTSIPVNDFIHNNLRSFYPLNESAFDLLNCSVRANGEAFPDEPGPDEFFTLCQGSQEFNGAKADVYYNKPLHLLYVNIDLNSNSESSFISSLWQSIIDFFSGIFGEGADDEDSTSAPIISAGLLFQADFNHAYFAQSGNLQVKGVIERVPNSFDQYNEESEDLSYQRQMRVDYVNFSASVEPLREMVITDDFEEESSRYCANGYTQTIFLDLDAGESIDWRYLASALRLHDSDDRTDWGVEDNPLCHLHNGAIDHESEECDDLSPNNLQEIYVLNLSFGQDNNHITCGEYDSSYNDTSAENNLITRCIDGQLDAMQCEQGDVILFVTADDYFGDLNDRYPGGADGICRAEAANIDGVDDDNYARAILSTWYNENVQTDAIDLFPNHDYDIYNTAGELISPSVEDLFDAETDLVNKILLPDESSIGTAASATWTGSYSAGTARPTPSGNAELYDCGNWEDVTYMGSYGDADSQQGGQWMNAETTHDRECGSAKRVYCIVSKPSSV